MLTAQESNEINMQIGRYISEIKPDVPVFRTDYLVIGSGIAGLYTALKASEFGRVIVLTKKTLKDSNTGLAQGGIAAPYTRRIPPFCIWRTPWKPVPDCATSSR